MTIVGVPDRRTEGTAEPASEATRATGTPLESRRPSAGELLTERCIWSVVWLGALVAALAFWGSWSSWAPGGYLAPAAVTTSIAGLAATWWVASPRRTWLQVAALAASLAATIGRQGAGIHVRQYYSTDSGAFNHVAAQLAAQGVNPYTHTMASAAQLLQTPSAYWTYLVTGGHVDAVSYPAGSFLLEVPAFWFGFQHQVADWMDLLAWLVTGVLLFVLLPGSLRWLGPLLVTIPLYADVFGSGGTDALFLPFLVLAVWRWDRFAAGRAGGLARWMGPVALGAACAVKQTPWFCVPFLVLGVFLEARREGRRPVGTASAYLAIVLGVFAVVNLPYLVASPGAWFRGSVLPFSKPLVADGQGLVTLALHGVTGGVWLTRLTVASLALYVCLLVAVAVWYPSMKRLWMLLLPLVFFVAPRSLLSYLVDLYPAAIVAAATVASVAVRRAGHGPAHRTRRVALALAVTVPAAVAVAASAAAFAPPPLRVDVVSFYSSHAATLLNSVTVRVHNTTDRRMVPHFMVTISSSHPAGYWHTLDRRPVVLGPHGSAVVKLRPPTFTGAPTHGSYWLVQAYTSGPDALSNSPLLHWTRGKAK